MTDDKARRAFQNFFFETVCDYIIFGRDWCSNCPFKDECDREEIGNDECIDRLIDLFGGSEDD